MREAAGGSIYDLGYRHYTGPRLGRRHAVAAMYIQSLRSIFGIGRPFTSKIFPWLLLGASFLPALVQLGLASLGAEDLEVVKPDDYYTYIQIVLGLFRRGRRSGAGGTRSALADALALLLARDREGRLRAGEVRRAGDGHARPYVVFRSWSSSWATASQSMISAATSRTSGATCPRPPRARSYLPPLRRESASPSRPRHHAAPIRRSRSSPSIVISTVVGITLVESIEGDAGRYGLLVSLGSIADGLTFWFFDATPDPDDPLATADLWGGLYALTALAISLVCLALILRRYRSIQA